MLHTGARGIRVMMVFDAYLGQLAAHGHLDLHTELREAMRRVSDFGGFSVLTEALGITRAAVGQSGGLGVMKISTSGRHFTPVATHGAGGAVAVILPVWEPDLGGDLVDLLAFRLDRPALFFLRTGYAKCLGRSSADDVRSNTTLWDLPGEVHPSLALFPNPLIWLRADCQGTVVLNPAWLSYALEGVRAVSAHNERHMAALYKLLAWPGAPKIFLRQQREAA